MNRTTLLQNYILEAAITPRRSGKIPINAWALTDSKTMSCPFGQVYADAEIGALTRPLKITIGVENNDWSGLMVRSFRQIPAKQILPAAPTRRPMLQMYKANGQKTRRTLFAKTQGHSRGLPVSFYTVECTLGGAIRGTARQLFTSTFLISADGKKWAEIFKSGVVADNNQWTEGQSLTNDAALNLAIGIQCFTEYCWTVEFSYDNHSMPVLFATDEATARRLVAQTERASEEERRKKIIHFVSEHDRTIDPGEEIKTHVMSHMRGAMFYVWKGCKMKVMPPVNSLYSFERNTKKIKSVRRAVFASQ